MHVVCVGNLLHLIYYLEAQENKKIPKDAEQIFDVHLQSAYICFHFFEEPETNL